MKNLVFFKKIQAVLCLIILSAATLVQAQNNSTQTSTTQATGKKSKFSVKYYGNMSGSSLGNPGAYRSDQTGNVRQTNGRRAEFFHDPSVSYNYYGNQSAFIKTPFTTYARPNQKGDSAEMGDPSVGVQNPKLVDGDEFTLFANISYAAATSTLSRDKKETFAIGSTDIPEYRAVDSKLVYRSVNILKRYFFSDDQKNAQKNFKADLGPEIQYRISEKLFPAIGAKIIYNHSDQDYWDKWSQSDRTMNLSVYWVPNKSLKIVPQLRLLDPREISDRNTEVGMLVYGTFL